MKLNVKKPYLYTTLCFIYLSIFIIPTMFFGFNIYLYLFAILASSIFILKLPEVGLYTIIICAMIYERFFTLQPIIWDNALYKIYPLDIIILITFISIILHYLINRPWQKIKINRLEVSALAFLIITIISLIISLIKNPDKTLALATFKNYFYLIVLFLPIILIKTKEQFKIIINIFLAGGLMLIFFVVFGLLSGNGLWSEFTPGTRFLAQTHTYYLLLPVFLGIAFLMYGKEIYGKVKTQFILLIQIIGIIAGLHRHLWLGFIAGLSSIFILSERKKKKILIKNILLICVIALVIFFAWYWVNLLLNNNLDIKAISYFSKLGERVGSLFQFKPYNMEEAAAWRLKAWQEGLVQFAKNPILGIGFGKMLNVDFRGFTSTVEMRGLHNDFLGIIIQMGILGIIPFIYINYYVIKYFIKLYKSKIQEEPQLISLFAFYIASTIGIFFALYLVTNMLNIFYWITIGLIVCLYNFYVREYKVRSLPKR